MEAIFTEKEMKKKEPSPLSGFIIPALVAVFNILIILFPTDILSAAREGLSLWFNNVMPALLPFIIGTNLLAGLGFVSFLGTLLEPVMLPVFGVPGCGGYALVTGLTSGYPVGAKAVAMLRDTKQVNRVEAQRLLAFCNNSGPLFMLGAVGLGMFQSVSFGYFLMGCHMVAALFTGLLFKFYRYQKPQPTQPNKNLLRQAFRSLRQARQADGRSFGQLLGDSVRQAMETIVTVGGFIVLFCVLARILTVTGCIGLLTALCAPLIQTMGLSEQAFSGAFIGFVEVTNGCKVLAAEGINQMQAAIVTGLVSFGGLSIFAQTVAFTRHTDINPMVTFLSKVIHGVMAAVAAYVLYPVCMKGFSSQSQAGFVPVYQQLSWDVLHNVLYACGLFAMSVAALLALVIIVSIFRLSFGKKRRKYY